MKKAPEFYIESDELQRRSNKKIIRGSRRHRSTAKIQVLKSGVSHSFIKEQMTPKFPKDQIDSIRKLFLC